MMIQGISHRTGSLVATVVALSALLIVLAAPVSATVVAGITGNQITILDTEGGTADFGQVLIPPAGYAFKTPPSDVALNDAGDWAAVVAGVTSDSRTVKGYLYLFTRTGGSWVPSEFSLGSDAFTPQQVTFSPDGTQVAVGNYGGSRIKIVEIACSSITTKDIRTTYSPDYKPRAVGYTRDGFLVVGVDGTVTEDYVVYYGNYGADPGPTFLISAGLPDCLATDPNTRTVVISSRGSNQISIVDPDSSFPSVSTALVAPGEPDITADGRYALVPNTNSNTVTIIDLENPTTPVAMIPVATGSWGIGYARSVAVINEDEALVAGSGGVARITGLSSLPGTSQVQVAQVSGGAIDHIAVAPWAAPYIPVVNQPPAIDSIPDVAVEEGEPVTIPVSGSDPDSDPLTYAVSTLPDGASFDAQNGVFTWTPAPGQAGTYEVTFTVTDDEGASASTTVTITVTPAPVTDDQAPIVTSTGPNPVAVGTPIIITAQASDEATGGSALASAAYSLDDWASGVGISDISIDGPRATLSFQLSGLAAGVYRVQISATDEHGNVGYLAEPLIVVVYDPSAGFVTGGGWTDSTQGKATFGFVAKYQKGTTVPKGETTLNVNGAGIAFRSDSYQYLVVNGATAEIRGTGSVNGEPGYAMTLRVVDGGKSDAVSFRLVAPGGEVVFETGEPAPLGGGSIVIHGSK